MNSLKVEWFREIDGLPTLPGHILEALDECGRVSELDYNIIQKIQEDPPIALRVLKIANSILYGRSAKVSSLQKAAARLGPDMIRNIVLTTPVLELYGDDELGKSGIEFQALWTYMKVTAILAENLGRLTSSPDPDVCFTAGLIHDTGKVALAVHHPMILNRVLKKAASGNLPLREVEKEVLGFTHYEVAAGMFDAWGFPRKLIDMALALSAAKGEMGQNKLAAVVALSRYFAGQTGFRDGLGLKESPEIEPACDLLKITHKDLKAWTPELEAALTDFPRPFD